MTVTVTKSRPTSPGRRFRVSIRNTELHRGRPFAGLLSSKQKTGGRNNIGQITTRHIGGGHKKLYRVIDFKRDKDGVPGKIERIEYDPNRNSDIALILYADGERRYVIAPEGAKADDPILSGKGAPIRSGNALSLQDIPVGTSVHCIEMKPSKGAQIARSAGSFARYVAREGQYAMLRLRSGETRKILLRCRATVGVVGNAEHKLCKLGKAGASRWRGVRPTVRGVAMNPVDHPHGGGEGKTSGGRHPVSPTGKQTKGMKTRHNRRTSSMIVRRKK